MVPRSVSCTGKRDNAGHEKTTVNKLVIISGVCLVVVYTLDWPVIMMRQLISVLFGNFDLISDILAAKYINWTFTRIWFSLTTFKDSFVMV